MLIQGQVWVLSGFNFNDLKIHAKKEKEDKAVGAFLHS